MKKKSDKTDISFRCCTFRKISDVSLNIEQLQYSDQPFLSADY